MDGGWDRFGYGEGNPELYGPHGTEFVAWGQIGGFLGGPPGAVAGFAIAGVGGYLASEQISDWMESRAKDRKQAGYCGELDKTV